MIFCNYLYNDHVSYVLTVSLYTSCKFCARNTSILTLVGFNDDRLDVTIFLCMSVVHLLCQFKIPQQARLTPLSDVLNCCSEKQLVAHMQRYFLENFASTRVPIRQYQCIPKIGGCWACSGEKLCLWIYIQHYHSG